MYPRPTLAKAKLKLLDKSVPSIPGILSSKKEIEFPFNPNEMTLTRTNSIKEGKKASGAAFAPIEAESGSTTDSLDFDMIFDDTVGMSTADFALAAATSFAPVTVAEKALVAALPVAILPSVFQPKIEDAIKILYSWTMVVDTEKEDEKRPFFVQFRWSDFIFSGAISSLTVKYKMFDSDGKPLRATITVNLKGRFGDYEPEDLYQKDQTSSASSEAKF